MNELAVMLCGHGSRDEGAITEFAAIAETLKGRFDWPLEYGFLEFATPIIRDGLDKLREGDAKQILAVPGMLFAAGHVKNRPEQRRHSPGPRSRHRHAYGARRR